MGVVFNGARMAPHERWTSREHRLRMLQLPAAPYGDRTNQSSVGPVNRRGNMIEGMLNFLMEEKCFGAWQGQ